MAARAPGCFADRPLVSEAGMAGSWVLFGYLVAYGALAIYAGHQAYRLRRARRRLPPEI